MLLDSASASSAMKGCFLLSFCGVVLLFASLEAKSWVVPRGRWWTRNRAYGNSRGSYYFVGKRQTPERFCLTNGDCPLNSCCVSRSDGTGISTCVFRPKTGEVCYPKSTWGLEVAENQLADVKLPSHGGGQRGGSCDCAVGLTCVALSQQGFGLCIPETGSSLTSSEDIEDGLGD